MDARERDVFRQTRPKTRVAVHNRGILYRHIVDEFSKYLFINAFMGIIKSASHLSCSLLSSFSLSALLSLSRHHTARLLREARLEPELLQLLLVVIGAQSSLRALLRTQRCQLLPPSAV